MDTNMTISNMSAIFFYGKQCFHNLIKFQRPAKFKIETLTSVRVKEPNVTYNKRVSCFSLLLESVSSSKFSLSS